MPYLTWINFNTQFRGNYRGSYRQKSRNRCGASFVDGMLNRAVTEPVLDRARVVTGSFMSMRFCMMSRMSEDPPHPRPCPLCGIAMLGSKRRPTSTAFDHYECFNCQTVISLTKDFRRDDPSE